MMITFGRSHHQTRSTVGRVSCCHTTTTTPNVAGHREAKMSSKSFLRSGFKYISQLLGLFSSHLCLFVCQSCLSVCLSVCTLSRMFDFCFVCHHSAAAWASSPAHSASGEESFSCSSVPHRLQLCLSLFPSVCPHITLSVCLSRQNGRGVWLTLWVVTGSRQQLWGVSPASRDCRAGIVLRAGRLPPTDWSGRDYCPADPARHSPALPPPHNR